MDMNFNFSDQKKCSFSLVYFGSVSRAREVSFSDDFHGVAMPGRAIIRLQASENGNSDMEKQKTAGRIASG
jgi:hypothetical protein